MTGTVIFDPLVPLWLVAALVVVTAAGLVLAARRGCRLRRPSTEDGAKGRRVIEERGARERARELPGGRGGAHCCV